MSNKPDVYQEITDKMVAALEAGTAPWRMPWKAGANGPANFHTNKAYRGINVFLLLMTAYAEGYSSRYWLTFNQMKELGGHLKKINGEDEKGTGQQSTMVVFWQMVKGREEDADGNKKMFPMARSYRVFNLDQMENVRMIKGREEVTEEEVEIDPVEAAEAIMAGYADGPAVAYSNHGGASWSPDTDRVTVPKRERFTDAGEFYSTVFHELTHSTGSKDRLNRHTADDQFVFASHSYGREELVAEMGSTFLCAEAGVETTFDNSAAYLAGWIKKIREDNKAVVVAAGAAQKAADRILNRTPAVAEGNQKELVSA